MAKPHLTIRAKVIYILHLNSGKWLSIAQIQALFKQRYNQDIDCHTVAKAIRENNFLNDNIESKKEIRYRRRIPVTVYAIAPIELQSQLFS